MAKPDLLPYHIVGLRNMSESWLIMNKSWPVFFDEKIKNEFRPDQLDAANEVGLMLYDSACNTEIFKLAKVEKTISYEQLVGFVPSRDAIITAAQKEAARIERIKNTRWVDVEKHWAYIFEEDRVKLEATLVSMKNLIN